MTTTTSQKRFSSFKNISAFILFLIATVFSVIAVFTIIIFLLIRGIPAISETGLGRFLFSTRWSPYAGYYGIAHFMLATIYVAALSTIIGGSIGIFAAIFISRFCPKFIKPIISQMVNLLAAIPSVVYGMFGLIVIVPFLRTLTGDMFGLGILPASLILSMMIMPIIVGISRNALDAVPKSYYEGAVALGATHHEAIFKVVVPAAKSGIVSSLILGIGRALGETMAVMMVVGNNAANVPTSLLQPVRTLTTNVVLEFAEAGSDTHTGMLIATGIVLVFFVVVINVTLHLLLSRARKIKKLKPSTITEEKPEENLILSEATMTMPNEGISAIVTLENDNQLKNQAENNLDEISQGENLIENDLKKEKPTNKKGGRQKNV